MQNMFHSVDLLIGKSAKCSSVIATRVVEDTNTPAAFLPDTTARAVNQWESLFALSSSGASEQQNRNRVGPT